MKASYLCPMTHTTIIKLPKGMTGRVPQTITCSHINCGKHSHLHQEVMVDESVVATHVFYKGDGKILTKEEIDYLEQGGLLFKTIPEAVPKEVINEFMNTEEMIRIGTFISKNWPDMAGKGTISSATIELLGKLKGHENILNNNRIHKPIGVIHHKGKA